MRINRTAVIAICADGWGVTPTEFRRMMTRREVMMGDVMSRVRLEVYRNPMVAEVLLDWLLPGHKSAKRRDAQQAAMLDSFRRVATKQELVKKDD